MLPFTREQFFAVFVDYNAAVWPAQWFGYALGLAMLVMLLRPRPDGDRWLGAGLALMWLWTGVVYHGLFFSAINRAALLFGGLFALQGLLFAHVGLVRRELQFAVRRDFAGIVGWALMAYALLLYPLIGMAAGHRLSELPMFGITPCPVTLFTLGLLLQARAPLARRLLVIPLVWTLIGGSASFLLGVPQDWLLLASSAVAVYLLVHDRRGPTHLAAA